jgi:hypothetical protein
VSQHDQQKFRGYRASSCILQTLAFHKPFWHKVWLVSQ